MRAFLRTGGSPPFRIKLAGPAGNPDGIGSRLTIRMSDSTIRTGELRAGGGYLSQSPAVFTFGAPVDTLPESVTVRWPDGSTTRSSFKRDKANLLIRKP